MIRVNRFSLKVWFLVELFSYQEESSYQSNHDVCKIKIKKYSWPPSVTCKVFWTSLLNLYETHQGAMLIWCSTMFLRYWQKVSLLLSPTGSLLLLIFSSSSAAPHPGEVSRIEGWGVPLDCRNLLWLLLISVASFPTAAWCGWICCHWTRPGQCYSHQMALWDVCQGNENVKYL